MANTKFQLRRSTVPGKVPNTTHILTGELALNIPDKKLYSSNGTAIFEVGGFSNSANYLEVSNVTSAVHDAGFVANTYLSEIENELKVDAAEQAANATANAIATAAAGGTQYLQVANAVPLIQNNTVKYLETANSTQYLQVANSTVYLEKANASIYLETANVANVAFTGAYDDLLNRPNLDLYLAKANASIYMEVANTTALTDTYLQVANADVYMEVANLSTVATSGSYTDLINKPAATNTAVQMFKYFPSANQSTFTGNDGDGTPLAYTNTNVEVYLNGLKLIKNNDFRAPNTTHLTLYANAVSGDSLQIVSYEGTVGTASRYSTYTFTANSGQTTFNGTANTGGTLSIDTQAEFVSLNGVILQKDDDYTANATHIVLNEATSNLDVLQVRTFGTINFAQDQKYLEVANATSVGLGFANSADGIFTGNTNFDSGTLFVDGTNNRVSIGTDSPINPHKLTVKAGTNETYAVFGATTAGYGYMTLKESDSNTNANTEYAYIGQGGGSALTAGNEDDLAIRAQHEMLFATGGNFERLKIRSDGILNFKGVDSNPQGSSYGVFMHAQRSNGNLNGVVLAGLHMGYSGGNYGGIGYGLEPTDTSNKWNTLVNDYHSHIEFAAGGIETYTTTSTRNANTLVTFNSELVAGPYVSRGGTSWTTASDSRLKANVANLSTSSAYSHVKTARAVQFRWKYGDNSTANNIGFIAQDWESDYPEVIVTGDEAQHGVDDPKGMNYTETIPILMAALKEAITKIEALETENADFEARIAALEAN